MEAFVVPAQAIGQWSTGLRQNAVVLVVFGMGAMWVSRCLERWIFANSIQWLWHLAALGHAAESCLWSNRKYLHNPMREGEPAAARLNQSQPDSDRLSLSFDFVPTRSSSPALVNLVQGGWESLAISRGVL